MGRRGKAEGGRARTYQELGHETSSNVTGTEVHRLLSSVGHVGEQVLLRWLDWLDWLDGETVSGIAIARAIGPSSIALW